MQHLITRQHLRHAGIRFPPFSDGRKKLAVLQFNAIHRHRHLGHIDFLVFAIEQVVVTRDIGRGVADIAKEGTFFRYIGDTATYIARYDDLFNGKDEKIDVSQVAVSMNGIELQDREFFAAIREGREPNASVAQVLPCYQVLHDLEQQLTA